MMKKAQTWSMDVLFAVGIFVAGILVLYYLIGTGAESGIPREVVEDGKKIPEILSTSQNESIGFLLGGKVNQDKLENFAAMDYNETKKILGVSSDYCIYFEDDEGNVVNVSGSVIGVGSGKGTVGGVICGSGDIG
ncbi:hypothetical protein JXB11_01375 [Candidatus Woesearchaeota archaeon]|nr:hypothetical protein [Candidatus Woesearchaeota archaeon]